MEKREGYSHLAKVPAAKHGTAKEVVSLIVYKDQLYVATKEGVFVLKERFWGLIKYFKQLQFSTLTQGDDNE